MFNYFFINVLVVGDMLMMTGTDIINAFVLLSGIIMLPTNVYIVYCIAKGKKIEYEYLTSIMILKKSVL